MGRIAFTERELDVMAILWEDGPSTVAEVRERLEDELAYKTVLTMLRILEEKGHVRHTVEGRAHRFHPVVDRKAAGASAISRLVDTVFAGSDERLFLHLVHERELSRRQLRRLRALLDEELGEEGQ